MIFSDLVSLNLATVVLEHLKIILDCFLLFYLILLNVGLMCVGGFVNFSRHLFRQRKRLRTTAVYFHVCLSQVFRRRKHQIFKKLSHHWIIEDSIRVDVNKNMLGILIFLLFSTSSFLFIFLLLIEPLKPQNITLSIIAQNIKKIILSFLDRIYS